jgi:hypothetical protein
MSESRKWGVYCVANLQFKTYFKVRTDRLLVPWQLLIRNPQLKAISLSKNVVRSIEAQSDLPTFGLYPRAHRVTYKYYLGVLSFLQEDYAKVFANAGMTRNPLTFARQRVVCRKHGSRAIRGHSITNRKFDNQTHAICLI